MLNENDVLKLSGIPKIRPKKSIQKKKPKYSWKLKYGIAIKIY